MPRLTIFTSHRTYTLTVENGYRMPTRLSFLPGAFMHFMSVQGEILTIPRAHVQGLYLNLDETDDVPAVVPPLLEGVMNQ